jgi:hypothetical protein
MINADHFHQAVIHRRATITATYLYPRRVRKPQEE